MKAALNKIVWPMTADERRDKALGTALGFGILLDATVVQALLVPALVSLLGQPAVLYRWCIVAVTAPMSIVQSSNVRSSRTPPTACARQDPRDALCDLGPLLLDARGLCSDAEQTEILVVA